MGISVEFNPDLALRNISEFKKGRRRRAECIPHLLRKGKIYFFLKKGQRNYWLFDEIPLLETRGKERLSRPKASIIILEATHFFYRREVYTKGRYKVIDVFDDNEIHFNSYLRI